QEIHDAGHDIDQLSLTGKVADQRWTTSDKARIGRLRLAWVARNRNMIRLLSRKDALTIQVKVGCVWRGRIARTIDNCQVWGFEQVLTCIDFVLFKYLLNDWLVRNRVQPVSAQFAYQHIAHFLILAAGVDYPLRLAATQIDPDLSSSQTIRQRLGPDNSGARARLAHLQKALICQEVVYVHQRSRRRAGHTG